MVYGGQHGGVHYFNEPKGSKIARGKDVALVGTTVTAVKRMGEWICAAAGRWLPLSIDGHGTLLVPAASDSTAVTTCSSVTAVMETAAAIGDIASAKGGAAASAARTEAAQAVNAAAASAAAAAEPVSVATAFAGSTALLQEEVQSLRKLLEQQTQRTEDAQRALKQQAQRAAEAERQRQESAFGQQWAVLRMHIQQLRRAHNIKPYEGRATRIPIGTTKCAPSRDRPQDIASEMLSALLGLQNDAHMLRTFRTMLEGEEKAVDQGGVTAEAITLALGESGLPLLQLSLATDDLLGVRARPGCTRCRRREASDSCTAGDGPLCTQCCGDSSCDGHSEAAESKDSDPRAAGQIVDCVCGEASVDQRFMLTCDGCHHWSHGNCVGVRQGEVPATWFCGRCRAAGDFVGGGVCCMELSGHAFLPNAQVRPSAANEQRRGCSAAVVDRVRS